MTSGDEADSADPDLFRTTVKFHEAVYEGDMRTAWGLMTPEYRLVVVQSLLDFSSVPVSMRDRAAEELTAAEPPVAERDVCWSAARRGLMGALGCAPEAVRAGQTVHFEAPAFEVVNAYMLKDLVPDETGEPVFPDGAYARALQFIMESQSDGRWLVAGLGSLMQPGWPPVEVWTPQNYLG